MCQHQFLKLPKSYNSKYYFLMFKKWQSWTARANTKSGKKFNKTVNNKKRLAHVLIFTFAPFSSFQQLDWGKTQNFCMPVMKSKRKLFFETNGMKLGTIMQQIIISIKRKSFWYTFHQVWQGSSWRQMYARNKVLKILQKY